MSERIASLAHEFRFGPGRWKREILIVVGGDKIRRSGDLGCDRGARSSRDERCGLQSGFGSGEPIRRSSERPARLQKRGRLNGGIPVRTGEIGDSGKHQKVQSLFQGVFVLKFEQGLAAPAGRKVAVAFQETLDIHAHLGRLGFQG